MDWNPSRPDLLGAEFAPRATTPPQMYRIDSASKAAAMRVDSTVSQSITSIGSAIKGDTASCRALIEVLLAGQETPTNVTTAIFRPTSLDSRIGFSTGSLPAQTGYANGAWQNSSLSSATAADINGATLNLATYAAGNASSTDDVFNNSTDPLASYLAPTFDLGSSLNGKRILDMRLHVVAAVDASIQGTDAAVLWHIGGLQPKPFTFSAIDVAVPATRAMRLNNFPRGFTAPVEFVMSLGEILPYSGTPSESGQPFRSSTLTGTMSMPLQFKGTYLTAPSLTETTRWIRVFQVWLEVVYCDENRVSTRVVTPGTTNETWAIAATRTPTSAGATYAKAAGTDLTLVVRQPRYGDGRPTNADVDYTFSVPFLESLGSAGPVGVVQYPSIALNEDGTVLALGTPSTNRVIPFELDVSGTQSIDAQPYAAGDGHLIGPDSPTPADWWLEQDVSNASVISYEGIRAVVKVAAGATGDLTFQLKQGASVLATGVLAPAQALAVDEDPVDGWRVVLVPFAAPVTLAAATLYTIRATAANANEWTVQWIVSTLADGSGDADGIATYGGTTDYARIRSGGGLTVGYFDRDFTLLVYSQPDTPTGFTATAGSTSIGESGGDCSLSTMGRVVLEWGVSSEPSFAYYEIQRSDPYTDWETIARITDIGADSFTDYEGRIGIESCYRMRVVATTDLASPWTADRCATRASFGTGLYLSANSWPEGNLAYTDTSDATSGGFAERVISNPEADEVVDRTLLGRDGQVSFIPSERRFDQFKRRLMLYGADEPASPGSMPADAIRGLSRAALPYVCVCDARGGRWFCNVEVGDLTVRRPGPFYWVDVTFKENGRLPYPVDVVV